MAMRPTVRKTLAAVTAFATMFLAACSSSGSGDGQQLGGLKGEPIVVADISEVTGIPGFDVSPVPKGAEAAAAYINMHGGIGGRPIKMWGCDSKFDPGASKACAQAAVAQHPVVITGVDDFSGTAGDALFKANHIATFDVPNQTSLIQSDNSFSPATGGGPEFAALGYYWGHDLHATKVAQLQQDTPVGHVFANTLTAAATSAGVSDITTEYFNNGITDFSAPVAKVTAGKPDVVFPLVNGSQIPIVYGQIESQGIKPDQIYIESAAMSAQVFAAAGKSAAGTRVSTEFANPDDMSDPEVALYRKAMDDAGQSQIARNALAQLGFIDIMLLKTVLTTLGPDKISAEAVQSYLKQTLAPGSTQTIPVFMATPMTTAAKIAPGVHRASIQILTWDGEKFATTKPFFTPPQYKPAS